MGKPLQFPTTRASFPFLLLLLASVAMVTWMPEGAEAQTNVGLNPAMFWNLTDAGKLEFLKGYLLQHYNETRLAFQLAESVNNWIQGGARVGGNPLGNAAAISNVLGPLSGIFNTSAFQRVALILYDEISQALPTDPVVQEGLFNATLEQTIPYNVTVFSSAFNDTLQQLTNQYILQHVAGPRALNRVLALFSARDVLYQNPAHGATVDPQCYSDTMDFLDAVIGATVVSGNPPGVGGSNLERFGWALKMLDSYGKVSGGIMRGALHYVGSYDECVSVHAYIPNNSSLLFGQRPHNYVTEYDTQFCRVTFDLPDSVIQSFGVDTRGLVLRLHWGMCFPDSCTRDDVAAMFGLGMLEQFNIGVHTVYCVEEEDIGDDSSAIVAIVILALLGGTVVLCTLMETLINFYNNNFLTVAASSFSSIEDPEARQKAVPALQSTEKAAAIPGTSDKPEKEGLPPSYVQHREDKEEGEGKEQVSPAIKDGAPGCSQNGGGQGPSRRSPPPSYSPREEAQPHGGEVVVPKIVKAFSVLTNMPKILSGKKNANAIHCLHGIRFFSMLWIMLGHTYNYGILSSIDNPTAANLVQADTILRRFTFQAIMAGGFTVDTFFVLSGLLVTYLTLKDMTKSKKSIGYWVMFYVHRFWRLTPLYMIVLMTFGCLHSHLGGGPLWPEDLDTASNCRTYWWTNLLYVNNLVHVDDMCMGWTWYLANDMQFYWISPIFLLPIFYLAPLGLVMTVALMALGISLSFYFEQRSGGDLTTMHEDNGYWEDVYITPWCRVAAYAVGILLGYILYKFKRTTLKLSTAVIGWLLTWAVGLFLCYITYTQNKEGGTQWNNWEHAAYEAFGRPAWAMCVAWIIFACHNNRGGWINSILSWEGFLPVSRLTYAAYLVHPVVMILHVFSKKYLVFIDDYEIAYLYIGHAVIAFLTALVFSLVAEAPALALEKLVFRMR